MAQLTDFQWLGIFLAALCFLIFVIHGIFIDPVVADTAERESTAHEIETIEKIEAVALSKIEFGGQPDDFYERDAHPTPHGCVRAHWTVDPQLEARFRHGVLAEPGRSFPAWVRFSNGLRADDRQLDVRGMAIKLMGVEGDKLLPDQRHEKTQDFVMINYHTFVVSDVDEFLPFLQYQVDGNPFGYFIGWNPFEWHLREMRVGLQMLGASFLKRDGPSPLSMSYFSMLPYKLGNDLNIKFSVWPCDPDITSRCVAPETGRPENPSSQFLREQLIERLTPRADARSGDTPAARFEFRVQVQRPNKNMPIENASIEWSQSDAPYVRVAELTIAPQRFSTEVQNRFCENLSFTPWHALPAHEPIGGLNRARKVVYDGISKARHAHNKVARHEPRGFCLRLDGQSCDAPVAAGGQP
jgi:hypothetical protein